jgi:hypothetical protein
MFSENEYDPEAPIDFDQDNNEEYDPEIPIYYTTEYDPEQPFGLDFSSKYNPELSVMVNEYDPSNSCRVSEINSYKLKRKYNNYSTTEITHKKRKYLEYKKVFIVGYCGNHPVMNYEMFCKIKKAVIKQLKHWNLLENISIGLQLVCNGKTWANWIPAELFLNDKIGRNIFMYPTCGISEKNGEFFDIVTKPYKKGSLARTLNHMHFDMKKRLSNDPNSFDSFDSLEKLCKTKGVHIEPKDTFQGTPKSIQSYQLNKVLNSDYLIYIPLTNKKLYETKLASVYPDHFKELERSFKQAEKQHGLKEYNLFKKEKIIIDIESLI